MTTELVTVDRDASLDDLLDLLADEERDINRVPVVDGEALVGIVARQDVLRALRDERRAAAG
jgi:CBS domain-containing protein